MMQNCWEKAVRDICSRNGIPFEENVPMSEHTTFKIGGPARLLLQP